jgi:CDP-diacylglycerol--glycerol-3-phosphate 3-phosphatidyltransferase
MASLYDLKPRFQTVLRPLVGRLARWGVTANQVTLGAMALSLAWGAALGFTGGAFWALVGLPVVLFVRMALNALDGMLAREHGQASPQGAMLNEVGDAVSDAALYLPFAVILGPLWGLPVVLFLLAEICGVVPQIAGGERRYDGPMGKSDRAAFYSALALLGAFGTIPPGVATLSAAAICVLAGWTIGNRLAGGLYA